MFGNVGNGTIRLHTKFWLSIFYCSRYQSLWKLKMPLPNWTSLEVVLCIWNCFTHSSHLVEICDQQMANHTFLVQNLKQFYGCVSNQHFLCFPILLQLFYGSLDFVQDYPGEPVPEGKTKTNVDFLEQETVSGSGISWAICKSAPHPDR